MSSERGRCPRLHLPSHVTHSTHQGDSYAPLPPVPGVDRQTRLGPAQGLPHQNQTERWPSPGSIGSCFSSCQEHLLCAAPRSHLHALPLPCGAVMLSPHLPDGEAGGREVGRLGRAQGQRRQGGAAGVRRVWSPVGCASLLSLLSCLTDKSAALGAFPRYQAARDLIYGALR